MSFLSRLFNTETESLFTTANRVTIETDYLEYLEEAAEMLEASDIVFEELDEEWRQNYNLLLAIACEISKENQNLIDEVTMLEHAATDNSDVYRRLLTSHSELVIERNELLDRLDSFETEQKELNLDIEYAIKRNFQLGQENINLEAKLDRLKALVSGF